MVLLLILCSLLFYCALEVFYCFVVVNRDWAAASDWLAEEVVCEV